MTPLKKTEYFLSQRYEIYNVSEISQSRKWGFASLFINCLIGSLGPKRSNNACFMRCRFQKQVIGNLERASA